MTDISSAYGFRGHDQVRWGISILFSTIVFSACYLLVPLGVVMAAAHAPSNISGLAAVASIPLFWFAPIVVSIAVAIILWEIADGKKGVNGGWMIGIGVGATLLTAVWFLPYWSQSWPAAAEILTPLRVLNILNSSWLRVVSWLVYLPMMVSVNLGAVATDGDASSSDDHVGEKESNRTRHISDPASEIGAESDENQAQEQPLDTFNYRWETAPDTRFPDVGGMDDLKSEIERSVLRPLTSTDAAYERFNISPPNGILLYGPPGTGKTHFARAIAGELGHPYLELSAGDLKSQWINESTEKVTQLFREAEQFERCVIFIDEIDALLAERGNDLHHEHAQVVNEFLAQLDAENPNFLLIAATNQAERLDEAATRRGRFDQQYEIGLPDREAREAIFRVQLRNLPTELDKQDYQELATQSEGLSSAEIVGIIEDAAVHAAEREAEAIEWDDICVSMGSFGCKQ